MTIRDDDTETLTDAPEAPAGYSLDVQVGFLLRKAQQRHLTIFSAHMSEDLTPMQFAALAKLHQVGPCSQNSLGRQTAMDVATIKGVVTRLKARGLVDKTDSPADRRMHLVALTEAGRALVERLFPAALDISGRTLDPLSAEEKAHFMRLLAKLT
ncbi:MarR family winged helix-turn-helix transcriptional regulator [Caenispirillum salinarum]|nr:MarR family transcriptional regulator [Caenispirillum salinarum]